MVSASALGEEGSGTKPGVSSGLTTDSKAEGASQGSEGNAQSLSQTSADDTSTATLTSGSQQTIVNNSQVSKSNTESSNVR